MMDINIVNRLDISMSDKEAQIIIESLRYFVAEIGDEASDASKLHEQLVIALDCL